MAKGGLLTRYEGAVYCRLSLYLPEWFTIQSPEQGDNRQPSLLFSAFAETCACVGGQRQKAQADR
jgi:hypothetical protein